MDRTTIIGSGHSSRAFAVRILAAQDSPELLGAGAQGGANRDTSLKILPEDPVNIPSAHADRVVVGIDGSDHSTHALRAAAVLAEALRIRLDVFSCWSRPEVYFAAQIPDAGFPDRDTLEGEAARLVEDAVERVFGLERPRGLITGIRYGRPAQILVDESTRARLLVVGRRGRGGFLGLRLGSVSSACIAHARCSLLVVNSPE